MLDFWGMAFGMCVHTTTRVLVRTPGVPVYSKSARWGRGQGSVQEFFYSNLGKPCLHGPQFVHRAIVMLGLLVPKFHYLLDLRD